MSPPSSRAILLRGLRLLLHAVLFTPIAYLAVLSLWRDGRPSLSAYVESLDPKVWPILFRTLYLAAGSTLLALLLGGAAGALLERRAFPCRGLLRVVSLSPLVLPPVFHVAVWERLAAAGGPLLALFPSAAAPGKPFPIRNELFVIIVLGVSFSPLALFFTSEGLRGISRELVEAARVTRGPATVLLRVMLPLAAPSIAAGAGVIFTLSLLGYEVPRLLDVTTYPVLINVSYGALDDPGLAFAAALPLFILSSALLAATESWADRRGFAIAGRESRDSLHPERRAGASTWALLGGWWALAVALPVAVLAGLAGRMSTFAQAWRTDWEKVMCGGALALAAGILSAALAAALLLPPRAEKSPRIAHLWLLLALPGSLLGFAFVRIFQLGPLFRVYDSPAILVLASTARFLPLAVFALRAQLRTVSREEWDAADLVPGRRDRWLRVRVPLAVPGLVAGASAVALFASAELPATLLLAPAGYEPVIVRIYNLLHYFPERDALAALSLFHAAAVVGAVAILSGLGRALLRRRAGG